MSARGSHWQKFFGIGVTIASLVSIPKADWPAAGSPSPDRKSLISARSEGARASPAGRTARAITLAPHPRLLIGEGGFDRVKQQVEKDATCHAYYLSLRDEGEAILTQPVSRYVKPDGVRLLAVSQQVLGRVYTLALLYRLDADERYRHRAWQELAAAAQFPDWNPTHFLDTAEMAHAFAIGYDWLYDTWSEEQRRVLRDAIVGKALLPAHAAYQGAPFGLFARVDTNWNQVGNGGIGMAALAVLDEVPEIAHDVLTQAMRWIGVSLERYSPDGVWHEGLSYWNYGTFYTVAFLAALETALGSDQGLSSAPGFDRTGFFPLYLTGPTGRLFNFGDAWDRPLRAPQLWWLARRFGFSVFGWYAAQGARPHALDLVWYGERKSSPSEVDLSRDAFFRDFEIRGVVVRGVEVFSLRGSWDDQDAVFVAAKAGENGAGHSHLDIGSFVMDALGVRWAIDLGPDDYTLPGYFGRDRWTYYRNRAEGHNTLVIDPSLAPDQDPTAVARVLRFSSTPEWAFGIVDLAAAYPTTVEELRRGVGLRERRMVIIQDEMQSRQPREVWWFMHTAAAVGLEEDGRTAILFQDDARLWCRIVTPSDARFEVMSARPLPSSPRPVKQDGNDGITKLAIHLRDVTSLRLTVVMVPLREGEAPPTLSEIKPLAQW